MSEGNFDFSLADSEDFDPTQWINKNFPDEASLSDVSKCIVALRNEIEAIEVEILQNVETQSLVQAKTPSELAQIGSHFRKLEESMANLREKTQICELSRKNDLCRDVKHLDNAKRNLEYAITALKRLSMLVSALDQVRTSAIQREYMQCRGLVEAIEHLSQNFISLRAFVPQIEEILSQKESLFMELVRQISEDFEGFFDPDVVTLSSSSLFAACGVVSLISPEAQREITTKFCHRLIEPYKKLFRPNTENSSLAMLDRRLTWFKRILQEFENTYAKNFDPSWKVSHSLVEHFCHVLRQQLVEILTPGLSFDSGTLFNALRSAVGFESFLAYKFSSNSMVYQMQQFSGPKDFGDDSVRDLPYADEQLTNFKISVPNMKMTDEAENLEDEGRWKNIISECFEAYMGPWTRKQEQELMECMNQAVSQDKVIGEVYDDSVILEAPDELEHSTIPKLVLRSASEIFKQFRSLWKKTADLSRSTLLSEVMQILKRVIRKYHAILDAKSVQQQQKQLKSSKTKGKSENKEKIKMLAAIAGTADYCSSTLENIRSLVLKIIHPSFENSTNFDNETSKFWSLKSSIMAWFVERTADLVSKPLCVIKNSPLPLLEEGRISPYVQEMKSLVEEEFKVVASYFSRPFWRYFSDKLVIRVASDFLNALKCSEGLSTDSAFQLSNDVCLIKKFLAGHSCSSTTKNEFHASPASKHVQREFEKIDVTLKILAMNSCDQNELQEFWESQSVFSSSEDLTEILALRLKH
eukprot:GHVP01055056.1.p1 GENE.GHVP01055056.1~~GHVP01055056.1.p1  ORF type:complete len:754 (-),score=151.05 GHVP01055056.1:1749-4010(-)